MQTLLLMLKVVTSDTKGIILLLFQGFSLNPQYALQNHLYITTFLK